MELFTAGAHPLRIEHLRRSTLDPAVRRALTSLAGILSNDPALDPAGISSACIALSTWCSSHSAPATAASFAVAAALASPMDPAASVEAGIAAGRARRSVRAETWFRRAISLSRGLRRRDSYSQAYVGLGRVMLAREALDAAAAAFRRAERAARRGQLRDELSAALQAQFELALRAGRPDDAERLAAAIPRVFAPADPRRFAATRPVAATWLDAGHPVRARDSLRPALRAATDPEERVRLHVLAIRAASALGDDAAVADAWSRAESLASRLPAAPAAAAHLQLAIAAVAIRDRDRLVHAGSLALELANAARDPALAAEVRALLSTARSIPGPARFG
ncbi:MAG: hypothetical protein AB1941_19830 [Gemmatimonadota bacterium]